MIGGTDVPPNTGVELQSKGDGTDANVEKRTVEPVYDGDGVKSDEFNEPNKEDPATYSNNRDRPFFIETGCCKCKQSPAEIHLCNGIVVVNPVVLILSSVVIWGVVGYCIDDPTEALETMRDWEAWIVDNMTWIYIGGVAAFFVFDFWLMTSRFGDVVLGKPGEAPRFSTATWFAMIFSAGIGIGMFFYGVSEPIYHYNGPNRWTKLPRFERAIAAMNVSWFHWGLCPSACYAIIGLPVAYMAHRNNMACNMRTVFYPLMKDRIYGIIGDLIDTFAIVGTMFGIGTSLGFGAQTVGYGMSRIFDNDKYEELDSQLWIIWIVTIFAAVSVATGLDYGIRRLSESNFLLGLFVLGVLALAGDTFFLLDIFVETLGHHLWTLVDLEMHTDSYGRQINPEASKEKFMAWWTIFYWGWWVSWSPFVGVFIAQISKGRTVREFLMGNIFVPTIVTSVWFTIYGGLGLEMELEAENIGLGGNKHYITGEHYGIYQPDDISITGDGATASTLTGKEATYTGATEYTFSENIAYVKDQPNYEYEYIVPACLDGVPVSQGTLRRLGCRAHNDRLWDVIEHHSGGLFEVTAGITLISVIVYFVTSSDSGSMVVDMLASNGIPSDELPLLQKLFWAATEGAVAYSVMDAGGPDATKALQIASIAAGLPFLVIMLMMCVATYTMMVDMETKDEDWKEKQEEIYAAQEAAKDPMTDMRTRFLEYCDLFIAQAFFPWTPEFSMMKTADFFIVTLCPCVIMARTATRTGLGMMAAIWAGVLFGLFYLFHFLEAAERGLWTYAWNFFFGFVMIVAGARVAFREEYRLRGDAMSDCCAVFFCYPFAIMQIEHESVELATAGKLTTKEPEKEP